MSLLRPLLVRSLTMIGVFFLVLLMLVLTLGLTGFSDRILSATIGEQLRGERTALAETIRDPDEMEKVLEKRREELEIFYGLRTPWYYRLPRTVLRVLTLDLGEARTLRSFNGSNRVFDIVTERVPNSMLLLTTSLIITATIGIIAAPTSPLVRVPGWTALSPRSRPSLSPFPPGGSASCSFCFFRSSCVSSPPAACTAPRPPPSPWRGFSIFSNMRCCL